MADEALPRPTNAELNILQVLWEKGPSTVREVHGSLNEYRDTGYTTVLKLLQIMAGKGLVRRDESTRAHVYEARLPREQTQQQIVGDVIDRVFAGSAAGLVMHALSTRHASEEEITQIRKLLDQYEEEEPEEEAALVEQRPEGQPLPEWPDEPVPITDEEIDDAIAWARAMDPEIAAMLQAKTDETDARS